MITCTNHPEREASNVCASCGKPFCADCLVDLNGELFCKNCLSDRMHRPASAVTSSSSPIQGEQLPPPKSKFAAVILCLLLGLFGLHRMYLGHYKSGFAILFCNLFLFWTVIVPIVIAFICLVDLVSILRNEFGDQYGRDLI